MSTIRSFSVEIPDEVEENGIIAAIEADEELIYALIGDLKRFDMRAVFCIESFKVDNVDFIEDNKVIVSYSYAWDAHYGCRDLCCGDDEDGQFTGRIIDGNLVLEIYETDPRTTQEEF